MEMTYCQSCGMPMTAPEHFGTNHDGSANKDYCCYCFQDGKFTSDISMDEMIQHCANFVDEFNKDSGQNYTKEDAIIEMKKYFPRLKRWKK